MGKAFSGMPLYNKWPPQPPHFHTDDYTRRAEWVRIIEMGEVGDGERL